MSLFERLHEAKGKPRADHFALLAVLVRESAGRHAKERKNWGDEAAAKAAKMGIPVSEVFVKEKLGWQMRKIVRVARELEKLGLIEVRKRDFTVDQDVYGAYGKKRLYTKQRPEVDIKFVVKKAGFQAYKGRKA